MRSIGGLTLVLGMLLLSGCRVNHAALFDPANQQIGWPPPPDSVRIRYVGELRSSRDLKQSRTFGQRLRTLLFGADPISNFVNPVGVSRDAGSRLFVCDSGARVLHVLDLASRRYEVWQPEGERDGFVLPVDVVTLGDGRVMVSDSGAGVIHVFGRDGAYLGAMGEGAFRRPCGMVWDNARQRLYVADPDAHQIVVLSASGDVIRTLGTRGTGDVQFNYPTYVALDSLGQLYVSDSLNFRVQKFDVDLSHISTMGSKGDLPGYFSQPKGISVGSEDHLYVVDSNFESVQLFDSEGRLLMAFGEEGRDPGQFWLPVDVEVDDDGMIWIADSYNGRIQVFTFVEEPSS